MRMQAALPPAGSGEFFLTEGGSETEIMYRHGFELPEFAMFPLLDDRKAVTAMRAMFCSQLDVAAEFGLSFLLCGLDYRASPDWGAKLGYSPQALADANTAAIEFLREVADSYRDQIPRLLILVSRHVGAISLQLGYARRRTSAEWHRRASLRRPSYG